MLSFYSSYFHIPLIFLSIFTINFAISTTPKNAILCMQCGGEPYEGNVSLTREQCCNSKPVWCTEGEICLRAWVFSPYGKFFLSGCHLDEQGPDGCAFHHLPHNSTVNRCICRDSECQNEFPGDCLDEDIAKLTTTNRPHFSSPPSLSARLTHISSSSMSPTAKNKTKPALNRGRHHHSHRVNSARFHSSLVFSCLLLKLLCLS